MSASRWIAIITVSALIVSIALVATPAGAEQRAGIGLVGNWPVGPCFGSGGDNRLVCHGEGAYLAVVDVVEPTAPVELGRIKLPYFVTQVTVSGDLAFVETDEGLWRLIDISDPADPVQIGSLPLPDELADVVFDGDLAYLGTEAGMHIVDLADPTAPAYVGSWQEHWWVPHLEVRDGYAYLAAYSGDFQIVDVSDPTDPVTVYSDEFNGFGWDVVLIGDYAYVAKGHLRIYDISDPENAFLVETQGGFEDSVMRLAYEDGLLVGSDGASSYLLMTFDTTDPLDPIQIGSIQLDADMEYLVLDDNLVYACGFSEGVEIVDVSDPTAPVLASTLEVFNAAADVAVRGDLAYLAYTASDAAGLDIMDIADPAAPASVGRMGLPGDPRRVVIRDHLAFVSCADAGLFIVDLADPLQPVILSSTTVPDVPNNICLKGNFMFVPGHTDGVYIFDIADPANPLQVGWFDTYSAANDIDVFNNVACVADGIGGIRTYDVSDVENPFLLGYYGVPLNGQVVEVLPGMAWLGTGHLVAVDITQPDDPTPIGEFAGVGGSIGDLELADGLAYFCQGSAFRVVDITTVESMHEVASYVAQRGVRGFDRVDDLVFLANDDLGFTVVRIDGVTPVGEGPPPAAARLVDVHPNPFNPQTVVVFELPTGGTVDLDVVDLRGRCVRRLIRTGTFAAGRHEVSFDGRDAAGRSLPAGVYLVRLVSAGEVSVRKISLVR